MKNPNRCETIAKNNATNINAIPQVAAWCNLSKLLPLRFFAFVIPNIAPIKKAIGKTI